MIEGSPVLQALGTVLAVLAIIVGYELLRFALVRRVRARLHEGAVRFVRRYRVRLESARFIDRVWLREALLQDAEIDRAVSEASAERGEPVLVLRDRVEAYVAEITPAFSLTAYYRVGALLARLSVDFLYELVFDPRSYEAAVSKVPPGAIRVFVINHRSNADYVLLSYGLLRHVALSYAVGEWARVWPLDLLFRSFGSYFIRRGEKDRLYHKVLERYVQLLVGNGGVTGFFIEGRLTRDGLLGEAKAGLLDYIVGVRRSDPAREIWFVPVGLNLDHALEDRSLVQERPRAAAPGFGDKARSLLRVFYRLPMVVGANLLRVATRSHRKFGYAAVVVGEPVSLEDLTGGMEVANLPAEERWSRVKDLAASLLVRVGEVVPVTPVPVFCLALLRAEELSHRALTVQVRALLQAFREVGAPITLGKAFERRGAAGANIPGLDDEIELLAEAELVVTLAGMPMERRGLVQRRGGFFHVTPGSEPLVAWYANSVVHHLGWGDALPGRAAPVA